MPAAVLANMTVVGSDMAVVYVDSPYFFVPSRMRVGQTKFKVNQHRYNHAHTQKIKEKASGRVREKPKYSNRICINESINYLLLLN